MSATRTITKTGPTLRYAGERRSKDVLAESVEVGVVVAVCGRGLDGLVGTTVV